MFRQRGNLKFVTKTNVGKAWEKKTVMKPTTIVYWSRAGLGVLAGLGSALLSHLDSLSFFNGISVALLIYILTYYVFKSRFLIHFEKPSKIFTTGVGAYFLTWVVAWVIFYTLLFKTPPPS
jgi:hypothetical protein